MDPIFVNRCAFNKRNLLEMTKYTRRTMRTVVYLSATLLILSGLFDLIWLNEVTQGLLWLALGIIFLAYTLLLPHVSVNAMLKRYDALYHTEIASELQFFKENITTRSEQTNAQTNVLYPQIKWVIRTKHLYLLQMSAQLVLLVDKEGFTTGSCEDFEIFIRDRAASAKFLFPRRTRV